MTIFSLQACYLDSRVSSISPLKPESIKFTDSKLSYVDIVSGSNLRYRTTASGFRVRQSIGVALGKQRVGTTGNYKVYSNVNGKVMAGEEKQ